MRRARSVSSILAAGPAQPQAPPADAQAWPLARIDDSCARAREDDILNLWWMPSRGDQVGEADDVIIVAPHAPIFWRGIVEAAAAPNCPLAVRWPAGLQYGPAAGTYEFPGPAIRAGGASVVGLQFQRTASGFGLDLAGPARQLPRTEPPMASQRHHADNSQALSQRAPLQWSEFFVPVLAAALQRDPVQSGTEEAWLTAANRIGEPLFSDTVEVVAELLASQPDIASGLDWSTDHPSAGQQDAVFLRLEQNPTIQRFYERCRVLRNTVNTSRNGTDAPLQRQPNSIEDVMDRLADTFVVRSRKYQRPLRV